MVLFVSFTVDSNTYFYVARFREERRPRTHKVISLGVWDGYLMGIALYDLL